MKNNIKIKEQMKSQKEIDDDVMKILANSVPLRILNKHKTDSLEEKDPLFIEIMKQMVNQQTSGRFSFVYEIVGNKENFYNLAKYIYECRWNRLQEKDKLQFIKEENKTLKYWRQLDREFKKMPSFNAQVDKLSKQYDNLTDYLDQIEEEFQYNQDTVEQ